MFTPPARRIISLVPSQTELLFDLGLQAEIMGITKFCLHPAQACRLTTKIGGTKTLDFAAIQALNPDLIIGNKEENSKADIEYLAQHFPVWMSDIITIEDALSMMSQVGALVDRATTAQRLVEKITTGFAQLPLPTSPIPVAYFIWRAPYMVAAADTYIDHLLSRFGYVNVFGDRKRYPELSLAELAAAQPQQILLSSEPYPFKTKHLLEFQEACPNAEVKLVDGTLYSWHGSRLLKSLEELRV